MTLSDQDLAGWGRRLGAVSSRVQSGYPGEVPDRQPVHTVYGGAHLFKADTAGRLGRMARDTLDTWCGSAAALADLIGVAPELSEKVHTLIVEKLDREPVEDFRLDFEDGYGNRSDAEEDGHAVTAAAEVASGLDAGTLPPFIGIRIKSLSAELYRRSLRTLDLFVTELVERAGRLPSNFAITLPKIQDAEQMRVLDDALTALESSLGLDRIPVELMVETTQMIVNGDGTSGVRKFVDAGSGRVRAAHFGTYDYTASLNITANHQSMDHPACDFARHVLQTSLAGTGVWISDGATNVMPIPVHRGDDLDEAQQAENRETVLAAMRLHYDHIRHSLRHGYYQGWDLHPAQLPTRYAAVYSFFLEGLDQAGERLSNFVESAAKATLVGEVFDDAATGQGLLNYFLRAVNCGAITEEEAVARTGLTIEELRTRSFLRIMEGRK